ncbi:hypothetical protein L345_12580, partial [Ophiophagus hannah]
MDGESPCGEDYECLPTNASLYTHMTAGAVAGILEHTVMYPVDSVKVGRGTSGVRVVCGESSGVNFNAGFTNSFHRILEVAVRAGHCRVEFSVRGIRCTLASGPQDMVLEVLVSYILKTGYGAWVVAFCIRNYFLGLLSGFFSAVEPNLAQLQKLRTL